MRQRVLNGKEQVFCEWRRQWVRLTPEEWVRQNLLHRLVENFNYPMSLIGVEVPIRVGEVQKRCDAIVFTRDMHPIVLIECKAEHVALTQKVMDQAVVYNRSLRVPYLMLHNGEQTMIAHITGNDIHFLTYIPQWNQLSL